MPVDQYENRLMIMVAEARSTINHEKARLEGLETALQLYRENRKRAGSLPADGSKFAFILQQIKASGNRGLTVAEMMVKATASGVKVNRNTLRSQLWHRKKEGMLLHEDGHYRVAPEFRNGSGEAQEIETPDEGHSSSASTESQEDRRDLLG